MKSFRKNKMLCGVGINDANYTVIRSEMRDGKQVKVWRCPFYSTWADMLYRCYSKSSTKTNPTYVDCSVCEDWLTFSNFKAWMETQDWEGNYLDKDLLKIENKVYCPEFCVFVSRQVNNFILERGSQRGAYKIGVCFDKYTGNFKAYCNDPFTLKLLHLGRFDTEDEAHKAWLVCKLNFSKKIAVLQKDGRVAEALVNRYENYTS